MELSVESNIRIEYRFFADHSLGKLAKWLRILGYDAKYCHDPGCSQPIDGKFDRGRVFLTRSKKVPLDQATRFIHIDSDHVFEQLKEIIRCLGIVPSRIRPFTRCICCNKVLQQIDKFAIRGMIPDYPWETHDRFHQCPTCRRIYWPGTHMRRNRQIITQLFKVTT